MSSIQILSLIAVALAAAVTYIPFNAIRLPSASKPSVLKQIEAVVAVREAHTEPAVLTACNALLQALLEVKA
jgi:hypothetical protein